MGCSPNDDMDGFVIDPGSLQRDRLISYKLIICQDYILQTSIDLLKENDFSLKKKSQKEDNIP